MNQPRDSRLDVSPYAVIGTLLCLGTIAVYIDWFLATAGAPPLKDASFNLLVFGSELLEHGPKAFERYEGAGEAVHLVVGAAPGPLANGLQMLVATAAVAAAGSAILVFIKAARNAAAAQVAWLLTATALFTLVAYFVTMDDRYGSLVVRTGEMFEVAAWSLVVFLAIGVARFLVIFPRAVDTASLYRDFWLTRTRTRQPAGKPGLRGWIDQLHASGRQSRILGPWHRLLLDGRMLWIAPLAGLVLYVVHGFVATRFPSDAWGGVWAVIVLILGGFYFAVGLPFAYASTQHLYRNGTPDERNRVVWLRAVLIAMVIASVVIVALGFANVHFGGGGSQRLLFSGVGAFFIFIALFPMLFVMTLALAVLYGGALDPRLAITRMTLWSILGISLTVAFIVIERVVALRVVEYFRWPSETGTIMAGFMAAATFAPMRKSTERLVTRLADRFLPIEVIAGGSRATRAVAITDISGYTALSSTDESRAMLLGALLRRTAERHIHRNARIVKCMGDAVMLTFWDAAQAVTAVASIHREFPAAARAVDVEPLPLHSSIHLGEIVEAHDGDIYGQTVNVAARLVDAAARDEIVVSEAVIGAIAGSPAATDMGERRFKNVPDPIRCFRLEAERGA